MCAMARRQVGQVMRPRDTGEHVALNTEAFNAWTTGRDLTGLRFNVRDTMPDVATIR